MSTAADLIAICTEHGGVFALEPNGILCISAPNPLPDELMERLREQKAEVLSYLQTHSNLAFIPWVLQEWRRSSIPQWRQVLQEATATGDSNRAEYARWMLWEVLHDDPPRNPPTF